LVFSWNSPEALVEHRWPEEVNVAHKNRSNWSPYKDRLEKAGAGNSAKPEKAASKKLAGSGTPNITIRVDKKAIPDRPEDMKFDDQGNPIRSKSDEQSPRNRHRRSSEAYSFNEADDRIYDIFRNHGMGDYPHEKRQKLTKFYQLLMENQEVQNFTRLLSLRDVAIKHFIDCLAVTQHTELVFPLLDLGTGPGFPGIPLKIHYPEAKMILAEGVQKRVEFLKTVREKLELKKLDIIGRNINSEFAYPVQGVITRAVEDARNTLGNVLHSVQTGGFVYLMKGPNTGPEIKMALDTWGEYYELADDIAYSLPRTSHARRLLIFRKIKMAPPPKIDFDDQR
jgi:16S rRNA (guanine527-N7)-methyltransferase